MLTLSLKCCLILTCKLKNVEEKKTNKVSALESRRNNEVTEMAQGLTLTVSVALNNQKL